MSHRWTIRDLAKRSTGRPYSRTPREKGKVVSCNGLNVGILGCEKNSYEGLLVQAFHFVSAHTRERRNFLRVLGQHLTFSNQMFTDVVPGLSQSRAMQIENVTRHKGSARERPCPKQSKHLGRWLSAVLGQMPIRVSLLPKIVSASVLEEPLQRKDDDQNANIQDASRSISYRFGEVSHILYKTLPNQTCAFLNCTLFVRMTNVSHSASESVYLCVPQGQTGDATELCFSRVKGYTVLDTTDPNNPFLGRWLPAAQPWWPQILDRCLLLQKDPQMEEVITSAANSYTRQVIIAATFGR